MDDGIYQVTLHGETTGYGYVALYAKCDGGDRAIDGACHGAVVVRNRLELEKWQYCAWHGPAGAEVRADVWCERKEEE